VPVVLAPFGVAPPPPPAGWLGAVEFPPPPVPPPPVLPALVLPPDEVPDEPLPLPDADAELDGEDPLEDVVEVVFEVDVVDDVPADAGVVIGAVGTVSGGAPEVSVAAPPPPHAAMAAATAAPAPSTASLRVARIAAGRPGMTNASDFERIHPPAAMRAVVEVLLAMLVTPVAETKVLNRPRQLGWGRCQGQQLPDDLQRLAGLSIDVGPSDLCVDHDLATGGWRPHPVLLTQPHSEPSYSRGRMSAAVREPLADRAGAAGGPVSPPADGLDRVPPLKVWRSRWDASPRS
jgi:hypothetical protein